MSKANEAGTVAAEAQAAVEAAVEAVLTAAEAQETQEPVTPPEPKMVPIKLHYDKQHTEDLYVSVNGERYQIQRGELVMVPDYVAEVIQHSEEQDMKALRERMRLEDEYFKKAGMKN